MSHSTHHATAAEDRIPFQLKPFYGAGAFVNKLLADSIGRMVIVLNIGLGMNPALVSLVGALPRLIDALTDPLMGYIPDKTRTRWGGAVNCIRIRQLVYLGAVDNRSYFNATCRPKTDPTLIAYRG
jgi:GPH family glycoside/pentoside/hexuronide:cation symporter